MTYSYEWVKKRGPRERIYLFFLGMAVIYLFFVYLFLKPAIAQKKAMITNINTLETQNSVMETNIASTLQSVKSDFFLKGIAQQKKLTLKLAALQKEVDSLKPLIIPTEQIPIITKNILNMLGNSVLLENLKDFPTVAWDPNVKNKTDLATIANDIYSHNLQMQFSGDYFSTLDYISRVEKLKWPLYWDNLTYEVKDYPKAEVVVKFHVLTNQKG